MKEDRPADVELERATENTWALGPGTGAELGGHLHASVKRGCRGLCPGFLGLGGVTPPFRNRGSLRLEDPVLIKRVQLRKDCTMFPPQVQVQSYSYHIKTV